MTSLYVLTIVQDNVVHSQEGYETANDMECAFKEKLKSYQISCDDAYLDNGYCEVNSNTSVCMNTVYVENNQSKR